MKKLIFIIITLTAFASCNNAKKQATQQSENKTEKTFAYICGGIVRGDTAERKIAIVSTSDGYFDGYETISAALQKHKAHASFFFTGNAYRKPEFKTIVEKLKADGNYLGGHSDKHLLYCAWEKRDSTLVSKTEFLNDIEANYAEMQKFGISKQDAPYFLPAYEYYNDTISAWTKEFGAQIVNFTGGTGSNADYTVPSMGNKYHDSKTLYDKILKYEAETPNGLNGFMLLIHFGTDPERTDKFYSMLDDLMTQLETRGYTFVTVKELLK